MQLITSNEPVIRLNNISKCYRIFENPQDRLKQALRDRFGRWLGVKTDKLLYREHWALRDIDFEIGAGEAVGILGRNGAGKSTLLQIIAGTLTPTTGNVSIVGRVTALLELGSGFNPEFTGRENVFHNAQILGLTRKEAEERFDAIAGFADIGEFLEQPVKTYSSGMVMRLAFAVQTSVSPKILIVDEALSVGDMFFQAKCMARINKLVDDGVTLLFVSHDIGSIRQVCARAVMLDSGNLVHDGIVADVSDYYTKAQLEDRNRAALSRQKISINLDRGNPTEPLPAKNPAMEASKVEILDMKFGIEVFRENSKNNRIGNGTAEILNVQMQKGEQHAVDFEFGELVKIRVHAVFYTNLTNVNQCVVIRTLQGMHVVFMDTRLSNEIDRQYLAGETYLFEWSLRLPLQHGHYGLLVALSHPPINPGEDWVTVDSVPHAYGFSIAPRSSGMIDALIALPVELAIK